MGRRGDRTRPADRAREIIKVKQRVKILIKAREEMVMPDRKSDNLQQADSLKKIPFIIRHFL